MSEPVRIPFAAVRHRLIRRAVLATVALTLIVVAAATSEGVGRWIHGAFAVGFAYLVARAWQRLGERRGELVLGERSLVLEASERLEVDFASIERVHDARATIFFSRRAMLILAAAGERRAGVVTLEEDVIGEEAYAALLAALTARGLVTGPARP